MAPSSSGAPPSTPPEVSDELVAFLDSGVSLLLGTSDSQGKPKAARAVGGKFSEDRRSFVAYLPEVTGAETLANLRENGRLAVTLSRPTDHLSYQIKGRLLSVRRSNLRDREIQDRYMDGFVESVERVGLPRAITRRLSYWPSFAIEIAIEALFVQTPGPDAGSPIKRREP